MKKLTYLACMLAVCSTMATAQSTSTTVTYKEGIQPALTLQVPSNASVTNITILQKLKEAGYYPQAPNVATWKVKKIDGFKVFNKVQLPDLNNQLLNLFFKVGPALDGDKKQSEVYLMLSKGDGTFISSETDAVTFAAAKKFLNNFVVGTDAFKNNQDMEIGQAGIASAEMQLNTLQNQEKEINNKIATLKGQLLNNQNDQKNQQAAIDDQKVKMEVMKAKVVKN